ncbi:hypothetical protein KY310_01155 [Candidatus Woesearchaeota archaeon]|nr:hypothetical protein [Candidatus Woesearchaeota archaeon]
MSKRGDISLEALVKFIPHFILVVCLIAALVAVYKIAYPKQEVTPAMDDLNRVMANLKQLGPEDIIPVFTTTHGDSFILYRKNHPELPKTCGDQACLCVIEQNGKQTCRQIANTDLPVAENNKETCISGVYAQCQFKKPCLLKYSQKADIEKPGDLVYVCRSCTEIIMSNNKAECLKHVQST